MFEKVITLTGCIEKKEHIWKRKITTKFLIMDARQLPLTEMTAKYQLFYLIYDPSENDECKTLPYFAVRCIDNASVTIERFSVIGEPTFETLLEWVEEYGNESLFKQSMSEFEIERLNRKKLRKKTLEEKDFEVAFVWND